MLWPEGSAATLADIGTYLNPPLPDERTVAVTVSKVGAYLAVASHRVLAMFRLRPLAPLAIYPDLFPGAEIRDVASSPSGSYLAVLTSDRRVATFAVKPRHDIEEVLRMTYMVTPGPGEAIGLRELWLDPVSTVYTEDAGVALDSRGAHLVVYTEHEVQYGPWIDLETGDPLKPACLARYRPRLDGARIVGGVSTTLAKQDWLCCVVTSAGRCVALRWGASEEARVSAASGSGSTGSTGSTGPGSPGPASPGSGPASPGSGPASPGSTGPNEPNASRFSPPTPATPAAPPNIPGSPLSPLNASSPTPSAAPPSHEAVLHIPGHVVAVDYNLRMRKLAVATDVGGIFVVADGQAAEPLELPSDTKRRPLTVQWTPAGTAVAVGFADGWQLLSMLGLPLYDCSHAGAGVAQIDWMVGAEAALLRGTDGKLRLQNMLRWNGLVHTGRNRPVLHGNGRLMLYHDVSSRGLASADAPSGPSWLTIPLPTWYMAQNWPIAHISSSPDGRFVAVAGTVGIMMFNVASRQWKEVGHHDAMVRGGLCWHGRRLVAATVSPDSGTVVLQMFSPLPGPSAARASSTNLLRSLWSHARPAPSIDAVHDPAPKARAGRDPAGELSPLPKGQVSNDQGEGAYRFGKESGKLGNDPDVALIGSPDAGDGLGGGADAGHSTTDAGHSTTDADHSTPHAGSSTPHAANSTPGSSTTHPADTDTSRLSQHYPRRTSLPDPGSPASTASPSSPGTAFPSSVSIANLGASTGEQQVVASDGLGKGPAAAVSLMAVGPNGLLGVLIGTENHRLLIYDLSGLEFDLVHELPLASVLAGLVPAPAIRAFSVLAEAQVLVLAGTSLVLVSSVDRHARQYQRQIVAAPIESYEYLAAERQLWVFDGQDAVVTNWAPGDAHDDKYLATISLDAYPVHFSASRGVISLVECEPVASFDGSFAVARPTTTHEVYIQYILESALIPAYATALAVARKYSKAPYFAGVLESLLYRVVTSDEDPEHSAASIRSALRLVREFPDQNFDAVVAGCARKVEMKYWARLFDAVGQSPAQLFDACLARADLVTANEYLIVVQTTTKQATPDTDGGLPEKFDLEGRILTLYKAAAAAHQFWICKQVCGFVMALDPTGASLRKFRELIKT